MWQFLNVGKKRENIETVLLVSLDLKPLKSHQRSLCSSETFTNLHSSFSSSSVKVSSHPPSILMCLLQSAGVSFITHAAPSCRRRRFSVSRWEDGSFPLLGTADLSVMYGVIGSAALSFTRFMRPSAVKRLDLCKRWNSGIFGKSPNRLIWDVRELKGKWGRTQRRN